ncbi:putative virion structural protein [Salmonella phage SPAsTU]|nr:putative virion structural protein 12 [Salmonella phage STsAS]AWN08975.1 putative virion structural protein [Salmonella phage SPAsTU]
MQFFSKEAKLLVYDQVNRDNPDLIVKLTPAIAALTSGPTNVTLNARNTKAVFTGFPGTGLQGNVTVYYDRVNLATLFNFVPPVAIKDTILTVRDALPVISAALGLVITAEDITTPDAALPKPSASPQTLKLTIAGNCPAYTGSLTISYTVPGGAIYPDSGPGPKTLLQGNTIAGYFGTTTAAELFTHQKLIDATFTKGVLPTTYGGTDGWYKFFYQGRVIYLPINPVGYNVTWNTLYSEGLVYGTDDNGKYPAATPVNQGKVLSFTAANGEKFYFRIRLPSAGKDPYVSGTPTAADLSGSEFEMFNFLYNGTWAKLTNVHWGLFCLLKDTLSTNTANHRMATLSSASWTNLGKATAGNNYYWFPVLELVDKTTTTLGLEEIRGNFDHTLQPLSVKANNEFKLTPVVLGNAKTVEFAPVALSADSSFALHPVALNLPKTVDYQPVVFAAEPYTPPEKTTLSSLDGELDGFK